ncbi:MAG: PEP-CTERM sorting domain-containing protein, partial [Phycisphaerae bacterium]|nr:PEP-CTERM sorting domain-containing protein [Phycisphaerae bacterium]
VYYLQGGANHFLGIISTTPIDYVIFDRMSSIASVNDFHFSPIPEPASAAMMALGLGGLLGTRRASRRAGCIDGEQAR